MRTEVRMPGYAEGLTVDDTSSEQCLALAADILERCTGVVVLRGAIAITATRAAIRCEVLDPMPDAHRCAEEFKVLVENARLDLAASSLAQRLPSRPLQWQVVDRLGSVAAPIWVPE